MTPELLTRQLAPILRDFVAQETKALRDELSFLKSQISELKPPERGEKGDKGDPGLRGEKGESGKDGKDGVNGKDGADGIGLAAAVIDKDGNLSITNTKGELKPLGRVVGKDGKDGIDGKNGADGKAGPQGEQGPKGEKGDPGENGKSVDISELKAIVADLVNQKADFDPEKLAKMFPEPKAGERGEKGDPGIAGKNGKDGKDGRDGKDADTEAILKTLRDELKDMVAAIEKPKDGKDGADGKDGVQGPKGEKGDPGKSGRGLRKAYINQKGELNIEYDDGDSQNCGVVVGKEGDAGLGFDDVRVEHDGERSFFLVFERGDTRKKHGPYTIPAIIGRGLYEQGKEYEIGDAVTHRGSMWMATEKTSSVPGTPESGWALCVKKGRDGRDGKDGPKGDKGEKGRPGRDLTQMDGDGNKW